MKPRNQEDFVQGSAALALMTWEALRDLNGMEICRDELVGPRRLALIEGKRTGRVSRFDLAAEMLAEVCRGCQHLNCSMKRID